MSMVKVGFIDVLMVLALVPWLVLMLIVLSAVALFQPRSAGAKGSAANDGLVLLSKK